MANKSIISADEATDRHGRLLLLCTLTGSMIVTANSIKEIAPITTEGVIDIARIVLGVVMALLLAPVVVWKFTILKRLDDSDRRDYFARDSFMVDAIRRGRSISWTVSLIVLIALGFLSGRLADVPAPFFFDLLLAIVLGVFALAGLLLSRSPRAAE